MLRYLITPRTALSALTILILAALPERYAVNASTITPACKVNLSFIGKVVERPLNHSIRFINNTTLAVAIVVHNPEPPRLVRPGEFDENSAFLLHAALLNANTGLVLKQAAWPTNYPRHSGLLAAVNSKLLVLLGNRVAIYSDNLELLRQLQLPGNAREVWVGRTSPSGRSALFIEDAGLKPSRWALIDTNRLRVLRVWNSVPPQPGGLGTPVSDEYITFMRCLPPGGRPPCSLKIRSLDSGSVWVVGGIDLHHGSPEFVADNLLVTRDWSGDISIFNLANHRVIRRLSPGFFGDNFGPAVSAAGADRFVVPVFSQAFGLEFLYVLDGAFANLRVLGIHGMPSVGHVRFDTVSPRDFALSPDGKLLAVLEHFSTLLVFRLPLPK